MIYLFTILVFAGVGVVATAIYESEMKCRNCRTRYKWGANFCHKCGAMCSNYD